ncbi:MAG: hypothetical protein JWN74_1423 [Acidobacteriaceae bacterium]|nr:hypothetical protein [Acidobacteriaceae bacterium]
MGYTVPRRNGPHLAFFFKHPLTRMQDWRTIGALILLFATISPELNAQSVALPPETNPNLPTELPKMSKNEFGIWGGYSPFSFVLRGTSKDRQLILLNLQYARVLFATRPLTFKYTAEIVPLALEIQPTQFYFVNQRLLQNPAGTVYGTGLNPVGFQANVGPWKIQPFANGTVGFLYFHRPVPNLSAAQLNYSITIGFGAQFLRSSGRTFSLGWKYHHLSNNYQAASNPGIDSSVFYAGISWVRRKRK